MISENHDRYVFGIFRNLKTTENCVAKLRALEFKASSLSISLPNSEIETHQKITKNPEAALTGLAVGGILGGALGTFFGLGYIPGFEPSSGLAITTTIGFGVGATVGTIASALIGKNVPEDDAKNIQKNLDADEVLLAVHVSDLNETLVTKKILAAFGAKKVLLNGEKEKLVDSIPLVTKKPGETYGNKTL